MIEKNRVALFDIDNTIYDGYIIFPLTKLQAEYDLVPSDCYKDLQNDVENYNSTKDYETFARNAMRHWAIGLAGKSYLKF